MTRPLPRLRARLDVREDRGSATLWFLAWGSFTLLFLVPLIHDGGLVLAARRAAINEAEQAARAGAQAVSPDSIYGPAGVPPLECGAAQAQAETFLGDHGWTGTASCDGVSVTVTVTHTEAMPFLRLIGIPEFVVTGHAAAQAERGFAS
jgi:hypothetical protein